MSTRTEMVKKETGGPSNFKRVTKEKFRIREDTADVFCRSRKWGRWQVLGGDKSEKLGTEAVVLHNDLPRNTVKESKVHSVRGIGTQSGRRRT